MLNQRIFDRLLGRLTASATDTTSRPSSKNCKYKNIVMAFSRDQREIVSLAEFFAGVIELRQKTGSPNVDVDAPINVRYRG
jgi:hypothetical protein